jgi:hypothetical protein
MKCDSRVSFLACTLASPCLGRKPKVRVVTIAQQSSNAKKVVDVLKDIIIRTSMNGKGVGLEGDDCLCTMKRELYDGNSHCLNKNTYT